MNPRSNCMPKIYTLAMSFVHTESFSPNSHAITSKNRHPRSHANTISQIMPYTYTQHLS
jgi:hypothetical protein